MQQAQEQAQEAYAEQLESVAQAVQNRAGSGSAQRDESEIRSMSIISLTTEGSHSTETSTSNSKSSKSGKGKKKKSSSRKSSLKEYHELRENQVEEQAQQQADGVDIDKPSRKSTDNFVQNTQTQGNSNEFLVQQL